MNKEETLKKGKELSARVEEAEKRLEKIRKMKEGHEKRGAISELEEEVEKISEKVRELETSDEQKQN